MKNSNILSKSIAATLSLALLATAAHAASLVNTGTGADGAGTVFAGFHATGGVGNGKSVVIDLGAVSPFSNAAAGSTFSLATIGQDLVNTFGSNWYERSDVLWGAVAAVQGTVPTGNTDATNTLYGSKASATYNPAAAPTTTSWNRATLSGQSSIAQRIINNMATNNSGGFAANVSGVVDTGVTPGGHVAIEDSTATQSWASWMPGGTNAAGVGASPFGGFGTTGFEQAFSVGNIGSGAEGALDVYRMYRSTASDPEASPATGTGPGSYQFTLSIDNAGAITAAVIPVAVPEPASVGMLTSLALFGVGALRRKRGAKSA